MVVFLSPILKVILPKKTFVELCEMRIKAIDGNIKTYKRTIDDATKSASERDVAAEFVCELERQRAGYQRLLVDHKVVAA